MYELCSWSEIRCHKDISAYFYASRVYSIRRHAEIWHRTFMVSWSIVLLLFVVSFSLQTIDNIAQQSVRCTINDIYILLALAIESCCNNSAIDDFVYAFPPLRVIDFAVGIIAYRLYTAPFSIRLKQWISRQSTSILSTLEIIIVAMSVLTYIPYCLLPSWIRFAPYFWIPFSLLIYWFAISSDNKGIITKLLSQRALVFLGNISFEIYMLHGIVITAFVFVWGRLFGYDTVCNPILFAICLVLSVVAAYIFAIIMRIGRYKNKKEFQ